jgi:uncharacterized protein YecE (DUF72 family)
MTKGKSFIGTAGWSVPKIAAPRFKKDGTHLERYAQTLNAVEINSSFYRHHEAKTYAKWAACTPKDFKFSLKLFNGITHESRLDVKKSEIKTTLEPIQSLKKKFEVLLVQLPKSLEFNEKICAKFLGNLRDLHEKSIVFEPRSQTWQSEKVFKLFQKFKVSQVFADPRACPPWNEEILTLGGLGYARLHGSPHIYKSTYDSKRLQAYETKFCSYLDEKLNAWCIFDNTQYGFATLNAVDLLARLRSAANVV